MGTISTNKLGAVALMFGPIFTLIFFFLQPGGAIIDAADPADAGATISAMLANSGLAKVTSVLIPIGLLIFLYGISVVVGNVRSNGNGGALAGFGMRFILFGVIGWVIASGASLAIAGTSLPVENAVPVYGSLYGATLGIGTVAGILAGIGFLSLALAVSTRDDSNNIAALVAAIAAIVAIVVAIIGGVDSAQLETMNLITGITYLVHTAWFIMIGLDLLKKE